MVVLPAPLGPTIAIDSPARAAKLTPFKTGLAGLVGKYYVLKIDLAPRLRHGVRPQRGP